VTSTGRHPKTVYKQMAKKTKKKLKWWKNSSTLFLIVVLSIPAVILITSIGMIAQRASHIRPSFTPTSQPVLEGDFRFIREANAYLVQAKQVAVFGLTHTHNVIINSAAGRMQKDLAAPAKDLAYLAKRYNAGDTKGLQNNLTLPGPVLAELNLTSDRKMAYIMTDFANRFNRAWKYKLSVPRLIKVRQELAAMAKAMAHDISPVVAGN
jgi:hypothetical protein